MHLVAGVDALGRVAHGKVRAKGQAALPFEQGHADFLGKARVDRGLEADHGAPAKMTAHGGGGRNNGCQVGRPVIIDGRGHGHNDDAGLVQHLRIAGVLNLSAGKGFVGHFIGVIVAAFEFLDAGCRNIEPNDVKVSCKGHGKWQAHIAQAYDGQGNAAGRKFFKGDHECVLYTVCLGPLGYRHFLRSFAFLP